MTLRESELIEKFARAFRQPRHASQDLRLGIGDDAAVFPDRIGREIVLTCDWFLEGTHFLREKHPPDAVGWKCLARAVSDIAAMGGVPRYFLLSLAIPSSHTGIWLDEFVAGLGRASRRFRCVLAGGDTTCQREILIHITVMGDVAAGRAVVRSGARPGDLIYVSGRLGEAELGLLLLRGGHRALRAKNPLTAKHLYPQPRLALGQWLARRQLASAMMDLSDGLSSDLPRLCAASHVGARLEAKKIPCLKDPLLAREHGLRALELALHGGDDYELLFTVPQREAKHLPHAWQGVALTPIGGITKESKLVLRGENGREHPLVARGWDPFRKSR